ncbi:MAG: hypothetical protein GX087_09385 [Desulfobulbaceae bacterium]|nr:hypothetical protein [Desulfobulbaceae bacterium]
MKRIFPWFVLALLFGCSSVQQTPPVLAPLRPVPAPLTCADFFPQGDWQYVHAIRFQLASGGGGSAIGVVVLTSRDIRCALTTVEGLTLFEARAKGAGPVEILRALPPFDRQLFAENLLKDIRTLFVPPLGVVRQGQLADKARVCRYETADGETADLMETKDGCWRLQTYNPNPQHNRSVRAYSCEYTSQSGLMPSQLELIAPGRTGYTINMRLISAQRLNSIP